ncbi:MAG TPA: (d)CMP kinase [Solirubrobacteraceae bacterium]
MIIAIDGPAGAGKSTVARALAARLGFAFLDTGALYRSTALLAGERGLPPQEVARDLDISLGERILVEGEDVTDAIRTPDVTRQTAAAAQIPEVRQALVVKQRDMLHRGHWVAEGRDIGTVVAPDADVKVFLTADEDERARRRSVETGHDLESVREELRHRDQQDQLRDHSPLLPADDALVLDTTGLSLDEVLERIEQVIPSVPATPRLFGTAPAQLRQAARRR